MKRILSAAAAIAIMVCVSIPAFAAQSSISIKNNVVNSKPISYTYDSENSGEIVKSIKTLMTKLDIVNKQSSVVQTLTVTSSSGNNSPVNLRLRLSLPQKNTTAKPEAVSTPSPDEISSLDYYNLKITSADGSVIYDYETDTAGDDENKTYKDIPLGTLNTESGTESKIYNVTISLNNDLDKKAVINSAKKLDWSIVSDTYTKETPKVTESPAPDAQDITTPTPAVTSSPSTKKNESEFKTGDYMVGEDIDAGRYTMTGEGKVHIYTPEGVLKTTIALKSANDKSSNGVSEYVINLEDGERVNIENTAKFTPFSQSSTPKPTSTAKATSTPKATSTTKPTSSHASGSTKSNPKTGDSLPVAGISIIGLAAIGGAIFIAYKKKKQ